MELEEIKGRVLREIDNYRYEYFEGAVGRPWPAEKLASRLQRLRSALVAPYWAEVARRDTYAQATGAETPPTCRCAIVSDDGAGTLLAFDPAENEFLLVAKRNDVLESFGVTGDAVGCFMAR